MPTDKKRKGTKLRERRKTNRKKYREIKRHKRQMGNERMRKAYRQGQRGIKRERKRLTKRDIEIIGTVKEINTDILKKQTYKDSCKR
jgi:hypothetical protein